MIIFALTLITEEEETMKSNLWIGLVAVFAIVACKQQSNHESIYREIQIDSKYLSESRSIGIYLPAGYSKNKEYPVIYAEDGMMLTSENYKHLIDSLIDNGYIRPIIMAASYENTNMIPGSDLDYRRVEYVESLSKENETLNPIFENHMSYFINEFIPMIEDKYSVSKSRENRIYFGTSYSADFGITLSMKHPELIANYWCFSPVSITGDSYPLLEQFIEYNICWGVKEELSSSTDYFQSMVFSIRKRGGKVYDWTYSGVPDIKCWRDEFVKMLVEKFGISN